MTWLIQVNVILVDQVENDGLFKLIATLSLSISKFRTVSFSHILLSFSLSFSLSVSLSISLSLSLSLSIFCLKEVSVQC